MHSCLAASRAPLLALDWSCPQDWQAVHYCMCTVCACAHSMCVCWVHASRCALALIDICPCLSLPTLQKLRFRRPHGLVEYERPFTESHNVHTLGAAECVCMTRRAHMESHQNALPVVELPGWRYQPIRCCDPNSHTTSMPESHMRSRHTLENVDRSDKVSSSNTCFRAGQSCVGR